MTLDPRRLTIPLLAALALAGPCAAGLPLTNPSFETPGPGADFQGWAQFGLVAPSNDLAVDGTRSASIAGPFLGDWAISAVYQDAGPASEGEVWVARVYAGHTSADPLTGAARGIMNIEWRDAVGDLISFDSVGLTDALDPTDTPELFELRAGPAPAGTASARLLLGCLQSPAQETGSVRVDAVSVEKLADPSEYDPLQWTDVGGKTLQFAGYTWRVKEGDALGPGPNDFSDSTENVRVDDQGRLRLKVTNRNGQWQSAEVILEDDLGYGDYVFVTQGRVDTLDPNLVLGLFTWEYRESYQGIESSNVANEYDIEWSRWGDPANPNNAQFVCQPWQRPGNLFGFNATIPDADALVSNAFYWRPNRVQGRVWRGDAPQADAATLIADYDYTGPDVPREEQPRVHINLWQIFGAPPLDAMEREVIISDFRFEPLCATNFCTGPFANPGFEQQNPAVPPYPAFGFSKWKIDGNAERSGLAARTGAVAARLAGRDTGITNRSIVAQDVAANAGQTWHARAFASHRAQDPVTGSSDLSLAIEFRDAENNTLQTDDATLLDAASPTDAFFPADVSATAPPGTSYARVALTFTQRPDGTGAAYADDVWFATTPPLCPGDADANGAVDVNDITYVVARLGTAGPEGDVDGSGGVDVNDITYIVARLGTCD